MSGICFPLTFISLRPYTVFFVFLKVFLQGLSLSSLEHHFCSLYLAISNSILTICHTTHLRTLSWLHISLHYSPCSVKATNDYMLHISPSSYSTSRNIWLGLWNTHSLPPRMLFSWLELLSHQDSYQSLLQVLLMPLGSGHRGLFSTYTPITFGVISCSPIVLKILMAPTLSPGQYSPCTPGLNVQLLTWYLGCLAYSQPIGLKMSEAEYLLYTPYLQIFKSVPEFSSANRQLYPFHYSSTKFWHDLPLFFPLSLTSTNNSSQLYLPHISRTHSLLTTSTATFGQVPPSLAWFNHCNGHLSDSVLTPLQSYPEWSQYCLPFKSWVRWYTSFKTLSGLSVIHSIETCVPELLLYHYRIPHHAPLLALSQLNYLSYGTWNWPSTFLQ